MTSYTFTVPGKPQGQGRPRFARMGKFVRTYDPQQSTDWKSKVAVFARDAGVRPAQGAVRVEVVAYLPRPQRLCRRIDPEGVLPAMCKPDADNIVKAILDALTGIAYADDNHVADFRVRKLYHAKGGQPQTVVTIEGMATI